MIPSATSRRRNQALQSSAEAASRLHCTCPVSGRDTSSHVYPGLAWISLQRRSIGAPGSTSAGWSGRRSAPQKSVRPLPHSTSAKSCRNALNGAPTSVSARVSAVSQLAGSGQLAGSNPALEGQAQYRS